MAWKPKYSYRIIFTIIAVAVVLGIASIFLPKSSLTNDIFLIPEGYEGDIQVNYNVAGAPKLEKEGKFDVIPLRTDGTYDTSTPDMEYGLVTDQYYDVDQDGRRTPIDHSCIHLKGTGTSEVGSIITRHQYLTVTRTKCGEPFQSWGS